MKVLVVAAIVVGALFSAPLASADSGDQSAAEQAITTIYDQVVPGCTEHHNVGNIRSIVWDTFTPGSYGSGRIVDAKEGLGGPFEVAWTNPRVGPAVDSPPFRASGQWGVNLEFC